MITAADAAAIRAHAYVLEQVPGYVEAVTGLEPSLFEDHVVYRKETVLVLVGYPLDGLLDVARLDHVVEGAIETYSPEVVSVLAPVVPRALESGVHEQPDDYYRLDLETAAPGAKVRNMVERARRELTIGCVDAYGRDHGKLVRDFLRSRRLEEGHRFLFERLLAYAGTEGARIYEARDAKGRLAAFDVIETGTDIHAFYAFNFRRRKRPVPGASDLLLHHVIEDARAEGKRWIGLGLGISPGVKFFKRKWGGAPYLRHVGSRIERSSP